MLSRMSCLSVTAGRALGTTVVLEPFPAPSGPDPFTPPANEEFPIRLACMFLDMLFMCCCAVLPRSITLFHNASKQMGKFTDGINNYMSEMKELLHTGALTRKN